MGILAAAPPRAHPRRHALRSAPPAPPATPATRPPSLTGQNISALAHDHDVSRKFVYQQAAKAEQALGDAFVPPAADADTRVLFHLPVTKAWLHQLALGLVLVCHSSYPRRGRAVPRPLRLSPRPWARCLTSCSGRWPTPAGTTSAPTCRPSASARTMRSSRGTNPCSSVPTWLRPFVTLLSLEDHRDGDTWAIRLWELQGAAFSRTPPSPISAAACGPGRNWLCPRTPCRGDVFHALYDLTPRAGRAEKRAYQAMQTRNDLERQQARYQWRHGRPRPATRRETPARPAGRNPGRGPGRRTWPC